MRGMIIATGAILLAGCGGEQAPVQNQTEEAATLSPGQYQAQWKVASLRSTDKTTPATNLKPDATGTTTACVTADAVDPVLFAEDGDTCTVANPYLRNGRLAMDLTCTRKGTPGEIRQSVSGSFAANSLEAEVSTTSYLSGRGNYAMDRTFTAKRLGECPPAAAKPPETKA
jgi:hypothetical protein